MYILSSDNNNAFAASLPAVAPWPAGLLPAVFGEEPAPSFQYHYGAAEFPGFSQDYAVPQHGGLIVFVQIVSFFIIIVRSLQIILLSAFGAEFDVTVNGFASQRVRAPQHEDRQYDGNDGPVLHGRLQGQPPSLDEPEMAPLFCLFLRLLCLKDSPLCAVLPGNSL